MVFRKPSDQKKTNQKTTKEKRKKRNIIGMLASGIENIRYDVKQIRERDPAAASSAEVLLLYPGVHALIGHRLAHGLHQRGHTFAARAVSQTVRLLTGIEIHPGATVGRRLVIDHGAAVVIGETAEIGDDCTIYQGVTL